MLGRPEILPFAVGVYALSILVWLLMLDRLFAALKERHPLVHDLLGRPAPGALDRELAVLRFVFGGRSQLLGDVKLTRLCGAMRSLLVGYFLFFVTLAAWLL